MAWCLCGKWGRYLPADDDDEDDICEEEYKKIVTPAIKAEIIGSVAQYVAKFDKRDDDDGDDDDATPSKHRMLERGGGDGRYNNTTLAVASNNDNNATSYITGMGILGRFYSFGNNENNTNQNDNSATTTSSSTRRRTFKVTPAPDDGRRCRICGERFFPTDKITASQKHLYHASCFKCTLCGSKLKNHPDEDHMLQQQSDYYNSSSTAVAAAGPQNHHRPIIMQCQRCKLDNDQKYKPRIQSAVAGQKVVVDENEQGDLEQVKLMIGDELEEVVCGMVPRCSTCGGDFLTYKGEIVVIGALKYHMECLKMGKMAKGFQPSLTLRPLQAVRHLPGTLILRISSHAANNAVGRKVLSTLFFTWTDKDAQLKILRTRPIDERVCLYFHLDEDVRANPNHNKSMSYNKRYVPLPSVDDNNDDSTHLPIHVDIMNNEITPNNPRMIQPSSIVYSQQSSSYVLCAQIVYDYFKLRHSFNLNIPCFNEENDVKRLDLARSTLLVFIQE